MSAVMNYLMAWPPLRLAQELYRHAKENAALRNRVFALEHELFWMQSADRVAGASADDMFRKGYAAGWNASGEGWNAEYGGPEAEELRQLADEALAEESERGPTEQL